MLKLQKRPKFVTFHFTFYFLLSVKSIIMKDSYGESLCLAFLFYSHLWTFLSLISIDNIKDLMTKISSIDERKLALHCIYWYVITIFMLDTIIFVNPIKRFDVSIYSTYPHAVRNF